MYSQLLNFYITANGNLDENIRFLKDIIISSVNEVFIFLITIQMVSFSCLITSARFINIK